MSTIKNELQAVLDKMSPPNILVIGRTGAGKSSLINRVFGSELAKTRAGLPVSDAFVRYPKQTDEKSLVVVYDSAGYETGKEFMFKNNVAKFLKEKGATSIEEQIHLAWYVVSAASSRFEYFDAEVIAHLRAERVPVIIVLSKADTAKSRELLEMESAIKNYKSYLKIDSLDMVKVAADPIQGEPLGVSDLVELSSSLLPRLYTEAFIARQVTDMKAKRKLAASYVKASAAGCFTIGFVPIPGTTPATTIATQTLLCTKIAALYGQGDWVSVLDKAGGLTISSMLTIAITWALDLFSSILPPTGIISGGISGATAATYITIIGLTYTSVFEKLSIKNLTGSEKADIEEFIRKTFREEFRKNLRFRIGSEKDLNKIDQFA